MTTVAHIYILTNHADPGVVKVGRTTDCARRLREHNAQSSTVGEWIQRWSAEVPEDKVKQAERDALNALSRWGVPGRREQFKVGLETAKREVAAALHEWCEEGRKEKERVEREAALEAQREEERKKRERLEKAARERQKAEAKRRAIAARNKARAELKQKLVDEQKPTVNAREPSSEERRWAAKGAGLLTLFAVMPLAAIIVVVFQYDDPTHPWLILGGVALVSFVTLMMAVLSQKNLRRHRLEIAKQKVRDGLADAGFPVASTSQ